VKPRIVRVDQPAAAFEELFEAARSAGVRVGWLDFEGPSELPVDLGLAARNGAFRAVEVAGRDVLSYKRLAGPPVFEDLVREHFTGCRLLLVRASVAAPELAAVANGWRLRSAGGSEREFSTGEFLTRLRKPHFP
jgi:hypothetical protein